MARTGKAGSLVILQPKPSITCKDCIPFLREKQNEKNYKSTIWYLVLILWKQMTWYVLGSSMNLPQCQTVLEPCQWCTEAMGLDKRNDT